jgi:hypothetical protein
MVVVVVVVVDKGSSWADFCLNTNVCRGHVVAQLVEALCYKPECRGLVPVVVTGIYH